MVFGLWWLTTFLFLPEMPGGAGFPAEAQKTDGAARSWPHSHSKWIESRANRGGPAPWVSSLGRAAIPIRHGSHLWTRFNYVHNNPVKHGYVRQLEDWPFSSYHYYLRTKGEEWLQDCWPRYPVIDYLEGDDFDLLT
jgi:hypothetical protein